MSTLKRLRGILVRDFRLDARLLKPQAALESLGIDVFGLTDLMFTIEDEFKLTAPVNVVELETLADIASYVDELVLAHYGSDQSAMVDSGPAEQTGVRREALSSQKWGVQPRRRRS